MFKPRNQGYSRIPLAIAIVTLLALGALLGTWSYMSGRVFNEATVRVTDSENALVAVSLLDNVTIEQGSTERCGTITNNMAETLTNLTISGGFSGYQHTLLPGYSTDFYLTVPASEPAGLQCYLETVLADWNGGNAEIDFEVFVLVVPPPPPTQGDVFTAHRAHTYGRLFNRLDELEQGDEIVIATRDGRYRYTVYHKAIMKPEEVSLLCAADGRSILTLVTCHPLRQVNPPYRLVVQAIAKEPPAEQRIQNSVW